MDALFDDLVALMEASDSAKEFVALFVSLIRQSCIMLRFYGHPTKLVSKICNLDRSLCHLPILQISHLHLERIVNKLTASVWFAPNVAEYLVKNSFIIPKTGNMLWLLKNDRIIALNYLENCLVSVDDYVQLIAFIHREAIAGNNNDLIPVVHLVPEFEEDEFLFEKRQRAEWKIYNRQVTNLMMLDRIMRRALALCDIQNVLKLLSLDSCHWILEWIDSLIDFEWILKNDAEANKYNSVYLD